MSEEQRSRSKSPVRRRLSNYATRRGYERPDNGANGNGNRRGSGAGAGSGSGSGRNGSGRFDRGRRFNGGVRKFGRDRGSDRDRHSRVKGDFGPRLARELDSTYEEKVNRNYSNSIFVGNLTYECTPEDLKDYFSQVGTVVRADIITSRGHHRGMGTVEFTSSAEVDEAIKRFDGSYLMSRQIFVRQDNPPPESGGSHGPGSSGGASGSADSTSQRKQNKPQKKGLELMILNLPYSINWQALKDMFKQFGEVSKANVELDPNGMSVGVGSVIFKNQEDMVKAYEHYNGFEIEGKKLEIRGQIPPSKPVEDSVSESDSNRNVDNNETNMDVDMDNDDNNNNTNTAENASDNVPTEETAPEAATGTKFSLDDYEKTNEKSTTILCDNLPAATTEGDLLDLFETLGKVKKAGFVEAQENSDLVSAVVEYNDIEDSEVCLSRLQGYNYGGSDLSISFLREKQLEY